MSSISGIQSLTSSQTSSIFSRLTSYSFTHGKAYCIFVEEYQISIKFRVAMLAQMVVCLPQVQQVRGSIPGEVENFKPQGWEGGEVQILSLDCAPKAWIKFQTHCSTYVEKAYCTIDNSSSIGWRCQTSRSPWCLLTGVGYVLAPGFTFSLPFMIIIIPHTAHLHYKKVRYTDIQYIDMTSFLSVHKYRYTFLT